MLCRKNYLPRGRHLLIVLAAIVLLQLMPMTAGAASSPIVFSQSGAEAPRTACSLHQKWEAISSPTKLFDVLPSAQAPYSLGKLSDEAIAHGLGCVNFARHVAGLPAVTVSAEDNLSAQYGAVLLAAANKLTHTPARPANMSDSFFWNGSMALCQSNIFCLCHGSDAAAAQEKCQIALPLSIGSYMDERGTSNRACVAHRRWLLNPTLQTIGIGGADSGSTIYQVLKVIGTAQCLCCPPDYDFISWPASGVFPAQVISKNAPWSITLNPGKFRLPSRSSLTVTVSREDGKSWTLNASSSADSNRDSFLSVNTQPYGVPNSIIFAFRTGENDIFTGSYHVTVSGLVTMKGQPALLDYTTNFFDITAPCHTWGDWVTRTPATCIASGLAQRVCTQCGATEEKVLEPLGHDWCPADVLTGENACDSVAYVCARCQTRMTDLLCGVPCANEISPCDAFLDMPSPSCWSHKGINFVVESGFFHGTSPTTFSPKGSMTRGMLVAVLWRIAGKPTSTASCYFSDITPSLYYSEAVSWASATGIVNGVSSSRFAPDTLVTREQAVTFLYRFFADASSPAPDGVLSAFADAAQVRSYAADAMAWATQSGIIEGKPGSNGQLLLSPGDNISREQAATIIMRCMQLVF